MSATATAPETDAPSPAIRRLARTPSRPTTLALLFTAAFATLGVARALSGTDTTWDMGIATQALRNYAHLHAPVATIWGAGYNTLGGHFSPITAVLAPAWWLWPSPLLLVVAQAALFGWSVWIVTDAADSFYPRQSLAIGAAYGLSFGLQQATATGFHETAFAVPLLAMVTRHLLFRRPERAIVWALPLLLVREDMGLTVAALGVIVATRHRLRLLGALVAVAGLGWTYVDVQLLIPRLNLYGQYEYWSKLPGEDVAHLGYAAMALGLVWPATKWTLAAWTFGITGLAALRSPLVLLAAPLLIERLVSTDPTYWGIDNQYGAPIMPIVFLAAVSGMARMEHSRWAWQRAYAARTASVMVAVAVVATLAAPLSLTALARPHTYGGGAHGAALRAAVRIVPAGVDVWSPRSTMAGLAAKDQVYAIGDATICPRWIIIDRTVWSPAPDLEGWAMGQFAGSTYRTRLDRNGVAALELTAGCHFTTGLL